MSREVEHNISVRRKVSICRMSSRNTASQYSTAIFLLLMILSFDVYADAANLSGRNAARDGRRCQKTCVTTSCLLQTLEFWKIMNDKVDPCTNFYEFACGRFISDSTIIDEGNVVNTFSLAQTQISTEIYHELSKPVKSNDLEAVKKTKIYYQNCMNEAQIEWAGNRPLIELLQNIGGWPVLLGKKWNASQFDWTESVYKIRDQNFPVFFPIIMSVDFDNKNSTTYSIKVHNAFLVVDRAFLIDGVNNPRMRAYFNYMMNVITALGAKRDNVTMNEMKQLLDFEISLYNISTPEEKLMDMPEAESQISIKELSSKYPSIPWLPLLNKILNPNDIFINETEKVYIVDPKFISEVVKLIERTPKRVLANFLSWRVTQLTLMYMPKKLKKVATDFTSIIEGTKKTMNRISWCLNEIMEAFPVSLSAMFVRKNFNQPVKHTINEIFENIRNQTRKNLMKVDWMDDKTRHAALEKLDAMTVSIGYAEELMDDKKVDDYYKELQITPGLYMKSAFNITSFMEKQNYKALRRSSNEYLWTLNRNVALVNAYYIPLKNNIEIPAGFLKSFFQADRPQYINYGTIGTMIGHEITHGFDNQGRKYDKHGNRKNWWESNTEKKFVEKAKCIIEQYNNYTVPEVGLNVNGQLTQGENIADNGGFKSAYHAYNEWAKRHNVVEGCLPYLNYTPQQMFWISAASNWCSKQRPEYLREIITTDPHSPYDSRVILSFSNIEEFAKDFNCKPGSKMNPVQKCLIW